MSPGSQMERARGCVISSRERRGLGEREPGEGVARGAGATVGDNQASLHEHLTVSSVFPRVSMQCLQ